jgi:radical SAM superfamily enzyme YgiQ (UPF0313 family)
MFVAFDRRLADVDVVCASVTYDSLWPVLRLFKHAKERRPPLLTVLGGPHVDETHELGKFNDGQIRRDIIDYAIAGDGDLALLALLRGLSAGAPGPVWPNSEMPEGFFRTYHRGTLIDRGDRPLQLDALPPLPVELADTQARRENLGRLLKRPDLCPAVEMIAQRGCDYACECCSERKIAKNPRTVDSILAVVELRRMQGFRMVFFNDSTFGLYPNRRDLLAELGRTGMQFGCLNRFDHLTNPTLLDAYRSAGFVYFYCAVEQFDNSVLTRLTKAENIAQIERSVRLLYERGFMLGVSLLYGLPDESRTSIERTLEFVGQWVGRGLIRLVSQSVLSLHPGTPAGRNLEGSFDRIPPHQGFPFDRFEEGQWYHLPHVTGAHLEWIAAESERRFGQALVRSPDTKGEIPESQIAD